MIFIGGIGRCGTTVLLDSFAQHSSVKPFWEPKFLEDGGIKLIKDKISWANFREKMINHYFRYSYNYRNQPYNREEYSQENVIKIIADVERECKSGEDEADMLVNFTNKFFSLVDKNKYIVEKTPANIIYFNLLSKMFPGSYLIHVYRSPVDCCLSTINQDWGPDSVNGFLRYYNSMMSKAYKNYEMIEDKNKYIVVKFEDLIENTREKIQVIFDKVNIAFEENCLSIFKSDKSNIGKGYKLLPPTAKRVIEERCSTEKWDNLSI